MPRSRYVGLTYVRSAAARAALGVASGQPRPDGMVLWTRLTGAELPERVEVQWELAHDEAFVRVVARGTEVAEADWAHSVHAEPAGLEPGRWYWYRFQALGQRHFLVYLMSINFFHLFSSRRLDSTGI